MEEKRLLTSSEVAQALGVGVSSVKRWTNEGHLETQKTLGGHRRYTVDAVRRFATGRGLRTDALPIPPPAATDLDAASMSPDEIRNALLAALRSGNADDAQELVRWSVTHLADRAAFLDRVVGEAMRLIGEGWAAGSWSVDEEHRASHIVAEVLDRMRPEGRRPDDARTALLAAPPGELHDLPLRMVRLVLEWNGWATEYYGADVPWSALEHAVARGKAALVALTARNSDAFESDAFRDLVRECQARGTRVAIGGEWARGGARRDLGYARLRTLHGFQGWLKAQTA